MHERARPLRKKGSYRPRQRVEHHDGVVAHAPRHHVIVHEEERSYRARQRAEELLFLKVAHAVRSLVRSQLLQHSKDPAERSDPILGGGRYRGRSHLRNSKFLTGKGSDLPPVSYF